MTDLDPSDHSLSFVSWNLAMLERSPDAPADWEQDHTMAAVRDIMLELSPDVILYQELPGVVPFVETHDMVRANPMSHSGNLATLIGNHLADEPIDVAVVQGCAILVTFVERDLTVANVHLAPGAVSADLRLEQLQAVIEAAPTNDVLVAGDTNTRMAEEPDIAALGLVGKRPPEPTWNGHQNRFRGPEGEFIAFFSRYFATKDIRVDDVAVLSNRAVEVAGRSFHLSDHYGFMGTVEN